jgi:NADPH:quinone reductase-like Zn-dependent oxidoreductase
MPKIARVCEVGGLEALRIEEEPPKQPGKGEVRLKVQAVGLNRAELMFMRDQYVEPPKLPGGLGYQAAGLVEAVGPDVEGLDRQTRVDDSVVLHERLRDAGAKR